MIVKFCITAAAMITVSILFTLAWWGLAYTCESKAIPIKFRTFKALYNINPKRWSLYSDYVRWHSPKFPFLSQTYKFRYFGFLQYLIWKHSQNKRKKDKHIAEQYAQLIQIAKEDIALFEEANKKSVSDSLNAIWQK